MSKIVDEVIAANTKYVAGFGAKGDLALPPARGFAILTCMDARLDPAKYAGLAEGDAHVIRNAGGRASGDAIRSLVISHKLLGTKEWFVIHHTNCGMELFTDEIMGDLLDKGSAWLESQRTRRAAAATTAATSSSGTRSANRRRASCTTSHASARTRSCRPTCRSTATSTT